MLFRARPPQEKWSFYKKLSLPGGTFSGGAVDARLGETDIWGRFNVLRSAEAGKPRELENILRRGGLAGCRLVRRGI